MVMGRFYIFYEFRTALKKNYARVFLQANSVIIPSGTARDILKIIQNLEIRQREDTILNWDII